MENSTKILLSIIRSGSTESRKLLLENREELIESLCREYDPVVAGVVEQVEEKKADTNNMIPAY